MMRRAVLLIGTLTFLPFLPVLNNGFVNWDDLVNLVDNPDYRGFGWKHLSWMFSTFHLSLYRPLTWMTLGLDYLIWDMNPLGYHLTSLLFHTANAAVFFVVALRLLRLVPSFHSASEFALTLGAALAALFFSLHPLRVEAIAWASARNDVVSALLILLTVYCYLRAVSAPVAPSIRRRWLGAALMVYVLSLLAKSIGMTLPLILLLFDVYPLARLPSAPRQWLRKESLPILREKLPFFVFAIGAGIAAVLAKQEGQVFHSLDKYGLALRLAESFYGLFFYLWKTILPIGLSPLYQRATEPDPLAWPYVFSAALVLTTAAILLLRARRWPAALAIWLYYLVTLFPVLGIVQFGHQVVADRYSYISCLGWALFAGAGLIGLWQRSERSLAWGRNRGLVICIPMIVLLGLGFLTWRQAQIWHDSERLWRHALGIDPLSSLANNNLAVELKRQRRFEEASAFLRNAVEIDPQFAQAHHNLGDVKAQQGEFDEAVKHYRQALQIDPRSVLSHQYLGTALAAGRHYDEATRSLLDALRMAPDNAKIYDDLGNAMAARGDLEQAARHYRKAIELDSKAPASYLNLGNVFLRQNQLDQASFYYKQALKIEPSYAQAHFYLGRILAAQGKLDEAAHHFRAAVNGHPRHAEAHQSLIQVLIEQGRNEEAKRHYEISRELLGTPQGFER